MLRPSFVRPRLNILVVALLTGCTPVTSPISPAPSEVREERDEAQDPFVDLDRWVKAGAPPNDPLVRPIFDPRHHCENCGRPLYAIAAHDPERFARELVERDDPALALRLMVNVTAEYGVSTALLVVRGLQGNASLWRAAIAGTLQENLKGGRDPDVGAFGHEIRRHAQAARSDPKVRGDALAALLTLPTAPMRPGTSHLYSPDRAAYVLGSPIHADDLRAFLATSTHAWELAGRLCSSLDASPEVREVLVGAVRTNAAMEEDPAAAASGIESVHACLCSTKSRREVEALAAIFPVGASVDPLSPRADMPRKLATCAR